MGRLAWRTFCGCVMSQQALTFIDVIALREPQLENRVEEGGGDLRLKEMLQEGSSQIHAHFVVCLSPPPWTPHQKRVDLLAMMREDESDQGAECRLWF